MTSYYFWGLVSSAFFLSSIPAIAHQLKVIRKRRALKTSGELNDPVTQSISLNQIASSYWAVYSFFLFGLACESPDLFLVLPRAVVGILLYLVIFELFRDRRSLRAKFVFTLCSISIITAVFLALSELRATIGTQTVSTGIVCLSTLLLAQGNIAQYLALKRSGKRGAVSFPMHLVLYAKDFTGMMFGLQLGSSAWAIVLMHVSNLIMRAPVIYIYLRIR
jgi:hypothetical protein